MPAPHSADAAAISIERADLPEEVAPDTLARDLAAALALKPQPVLHTLELLAAANTVPFIARYRKELTGNLDEVQIQAIADGAETRRRLHTRKREVLRLIAEQGKLTRSLADAILAAETLQAVDDLYLPYRPKRKTRAGVARERGLQPLADLILRQDRDTADALAAARSFVTVERGVESAEAALAGARDICAEVVTEVVTEHATVRGDVRTLFLHEGVLRARLTVDAARAAEKDPKGLYRLYYDFEEPVSRLLPHRTLAINRAEREDILRVAVEVSLDRALPLVARQYPTDPRSPFAVHLQQAIEDGYKRLLAPALEREVRAELSRHAEDHAIHVFATNLRHLLLLPPLRNVRVLGIDPGYRTGCKVAVIDETGRYIESATIYPHAPQGRWADAKTTLLDLIVRHHIGAIAIGNGTASRETEQLVAEVIGEIERDGVALGAVGYVLVNEAGASVYSASEVARQEFPDLDVTQRGTISIARRLQDPLAELVKIDPKAVGVGLYQHDVDQRGLAEALDRVVTSCVNLAGVDLNTASPQLLRHVSGVTARTADAIVAYRAKHGRFSARTELRKVPGLGPATFVQAAGFLKVPGSSEALDNTFIHPESYDLARAIMAKLPGGADGGYRIPDRVRAWRLRGEQERHNDQGGIVVALAEELHAGVPTVADILENLEKPGLDPRDTLPGPILRRDVLKLEDLREGMVLQGTVRNVVDFGAFVDIGVKQDGLVHVSQMSDRFVRDPLAEIAVGQVVSVRILGVDVARGRVQLSLRGVV